mmetsp:Transcript_509/g.686  ORF Transcript_509/g.686 Transcript_509/m.686 type:complete len:209 (-) Transcript_509:44-670(-)
MPRVASSKMAATSQQHRCLRLVHRPLGWLKVVMLALLAQWVAHSSIHTFVGSATPRSTRSRDQVRRAAGPPEMSGFGEIQQVRFLGRLLTWTPKLGIASKAIEAQAEMPLGIRIELQDKNFVVTEVLSGGAAALGNLDVQEGDIIHYITTDVEGGGKRITATEDFASVEELSQGILANSDELVAMVVEKPDKGALGAADFLTSVTSNL